MLNVFRSLSKSKLGAALFALFLIAIAGSFALSDINNLAPGGGGGLGGGNVAKVGSERISAADLRTRVQNALEVARRERPTLTVQEFVRMGGVEDVLRRMVDGAAIEQFAKSQGIGVSRRMEDGQIASAQAFRGLNGQFDQSAFEAFLQRSGITEKQLRRDIASDLYLSQLVVPATGASRAPLGLAMPYASMLLEVRQGRALLVPTAAFRPAAPAPAELEAYYRQNIARYTIPERRVIRYAVLDRAALPGVQPTEQEIAAAYDAAKADYAARETRTLSQVVLPSEAAARELAGKIAGGASIADAARAAGLEAATIADQTRAQYAEASSEAVAAAAFGTAQGRVAPPARSPLGWHVVRVDAVKTTPARTLDQVRPELLARLTQQKGEQAFADAVAKLEDQVNDGATFDEAVAANRLQPVTTPPLLPNGRPVDAPADAPVAPELAALLKVAFDGEPAEEPEVEQIAPNEKAALYKVEQLVAPTPRPLEAVRAQVIEDFATERGLAAARAAADKIAQAVSSGTPLAQAASAAGVPLGAPATIGGRRGELLREGTQVPPQVAMLFSLTRGRARVAAAPDRSGWYVVQLDQVQSGDVRAQPGLLQATADQFGGVLGQEYGQQLIAAARAQVGVEIDQQAVAQLKRELLGGQ